MEALDVEVTKAVIQDDKQNLTNQLNKHSLSLSSLSLTRATSSKLLHLCCEFDSVNCATALLINGVEMILPVPIINEMDGCSGFTPLHTAAQNHSKKCIELLVRKHARTELRTKRINIKAKAKGLLPLELALHSPRMVVDWGPDDPLDDLLLLYSDKDLSAVRLLAEKTREVGEVAYTLAMEGQVGLLAALLMVASERINGTVLEIRTDVELAAEKTTVYYCVIREAISIYSKANRKGGIVAVDNVIAKEKRNLLIREIELLHFFGASPGIGSDEKKLISPLIIASQAGDDIVLRVLLKTDIDVNEADAEGNSALHWCLKASKVSTPEHIRILKLLLRHGARIRQKNMLGITAVHIAAGNGNLAALEIMLLHDPDSVFVTSMLKETPLFFAAKNEFLECVQLLMRYGASTDVHNLRRERPIDLAKSQDMRAALNRTSVVITNRSSQQKCTLRMESDEVILETHEMLLKEAYPASDSVSTSSDEVCKYYGSASGCIRGSTCFYKHCEEDLSISKSKAGFLRSAALAEFKRKIFVGGLPPNLDTESLRCAIEEQFGPVQDARVLEMEQGDQTISRGFGFVTFKDEKCVATAVEAHYISIWGKKVEIKTAIPRWAQHEDNGDEKQAQTIVQNDVGPICPIVPSHREKNADDDTLEGMSWAERVAQGLPMPEQPVIEAKPCRPRKVGHKDPVWLSTLKKWLPRFLRKMTANAKEGDYYSLSSLKSDFKAIFGLELDHASVGYSKLSEFLKSLPDLCRIKTVHTGGEVANHMILVPNLSQLVVQRRAVCMPRQPRPATPTHNDSDEGSDNKGSHDDHVPPDGEKNSLIRTDPEGHTNRVSEKKEEVTTDVNKVHDKTYSAPNTDLSAAVPPEYQRFLQFMEPDPIFLGRTWLGTGGFKAPDPLCRSKHLVLEALARKRKEVFFLRSLKFYNDYAVSLKLGCCFACQKKHMLFANYPCKHLLWCSECKLTAMRIAAPGTDSHKCVVCDHVVERIVLNSRSRQLYVPDSMEFPPIHVANLRSMVA